MKNTVAFETQQCQEFLYRLKNLFDIDNILGTRATQCLHRFFASDHSTYAAQMKAIKNNSNLSKLEQYGGIVSLYCELKQSEPTPITRYWQERIAAELQRVSNGITATVTLTVEALAMRRFNNRQLMEDNHLDKQPIVMSI